MEEKYVRNLVDKYKTPLYLFNGDKIEDTYRKMRDSLPKPFEIFYSVKANPLIGICKILQKNSCGIEVASSGELYLALEAGFHSNDIIFTGPGKTYEELKFAIECNIAAINAESFMEVLVIEEIAKSNNQEVDIGIRIHPNFKLQTKNPSISMMGMGTQFGVDICEVSRIIEYTKKSPNLNLVCFHVYAGSQIFDPDTTVTYFEHTLKMFMSLINNYDLNVQMLDFGGGFGVSYDGKSSIYDYDYFAKKIHIIYEKYETFLHNKRIIFECGRYLLAENGLFLTEVQYKKILHDKVFLITDAGMNHHALSTYREKKIRSNFLMKILANDNDNDNDNDEVVTVAGPLCTPDDVLGRNVTLNRADRGDILCILNSGAYGSSFSPLNFLGHPSPCEVLIYKGKEYCLKRHGDIKDVLYNQEKVDI